MPTLLALLLLSAGAGPTPLDPSLGIAPGDYPPDAMAARREGVVHFSVDVDAAGMPAACAVTGSSGVDSLDARTCEVVKARGRFRPAVDAQGRPVPGTFASRVGWKLPPSASYRAVTVFLPADPAAPRCEIETEGMPVADREALCAETVRANAETLRVFGHSYRHVTFFHGEFEADGHADFRKAEWGSQLSRLLTERGYTDDAEIRHCRVVRSEGYAVGSEVCDGIGRHRDPRRALRTAMIEDSIYGRLR